MWPEVERAKTENRHELTLSGKETSKRLEKGLDPHIFSLSGLNYLDIHDTSLEAVPDDILRLSLLQSLVLHSNNLQEININVTKLDKLKLLDLSRNQLKQVPQEIDNLPNIVTFNFTYNNLEVFPKLSKVQKLSTLNLSNNKLKVFPDCCYEILSNLSELVLSDNEIEIIPPEIQNISALKVLELGHNKIKVIPGELASLKLKVLELKNNPISDRRLLKLVDQCRIKQIIDYIKAHCPKTSLESPFNGDNKCEKSESEDEDTAKYTIKIHHAKDNFKILIDESVKAVREFLVACLVQVTFNEDNFKKFIQIQNKLHDTVCSKRNSATIATHDFNKLPPGDLQYTTLPPSELEIHPLNRPGVVSGADLFAKLQTEAQNLRKSKKRNTYSGIHKYLYLIEGQARFPCLLNSQNIVISFPPITNSEGSRIHLGTKVMLLEVTSSLSLHACKVAMESLLKELVLLLKENMVVTQIKTTDLQGNLKVVFPSKTDLDFEGNDIKVVRD